MSEIDTTLTDGVDDAVGEDLRLALLIATQAAERLMQQVAEQRRQAEAEAQRGLERAQAEREAYRSLARGATRGVGQDRWWQEASPAEIAKAWAIARAWEGHDPELGTRVEAMRQGLADRYGITDPDSLEVQDLVNAQRDHRAAQVAGPVNEAEWEAAQFDAYAQELRERRQELGGHQAAPANPNVSVAGDELSRYDKDQWSRDQKQSLGELEQRARGHADEARARADRLRGQGAALAAGKEWDKAYDTAERRTQLRDRLTAAGVDGDAMSARVLADTAQGQPARVAARVIKSDAKARRPRNQQRQTERGR